MQHYKITHTVLILRNTTRLRIMSYYVTLQDYTYCSHIMQHYKIMHNVVILCNTTRLHTLFSYYATLQDYTYCSHITQHYKITHTVLILCNTTRLCIMFSYCTIITTFQKTNSVSSKYSGRDSLYSFLCSVELHAMKMYEKEQQYLHAFLSSTSRRRTVSFMPGLPQTWANSLYFRNA